MFRDPATILDQEVTIRMEAIQKNDKAKGRSLSLRTTAIPAHFWDTLH